MGGPAGFGLIKGTTTTDHELALRFIRAKRVVNWGDLIIFLSITVGAPFPCISDHVVEPPRVWAISTNGMGVKTRIDAAPSVGRHVLCVIAEII
jgi:hypothetical protein